MKIFELRDNVAESISKVIGAPGSQIALIMSMLSIIPFCFINYLIHGKTIRLIYSLVLGLIFQISIYKLKFIHILIPAIFTYLFIKYFGRKYSAFYVFVFTLLYLSYLHIKRLFEEYGEWRGDDVTIIYMMTISKYSSLAFSYEDGGKDINELKNSHHKEYRIVEKPTLLEVLSYVYFYPTSIVGPSIEFKDFINFINETDCYSRLNENLLYIFFNGFKYFVGSFVAMAFYSYVSNKLPVEALVEEDFGKHNLLYVLAYIYFCIPSIRAKYYSGWILSYATVIFSGLSYTEKNVDGKIVKSLEKGSYGSVVNCEWSISPKDMINEWNKTIHLWLKYNVYTRVININMKPFKNNWALASFLTFVSSAIWHGFYVTYYITFFLLFFYESACDVLEKIGFYKWIYKTKVLIPLISILNNLSFETIGVMFFNLEWKKALVGLRNMRYYPLIVILGLYVFTRFIKVPKKQKKEEKKDDEKEKKAKKVE